MQHHVRHHSPSAPPWRAQCGVAADTGHGSRQHRMASSADAQARTKTSMMRSPMLISVSPKSVPAASVTSRMSGGPCFTAKEVPPSRRCMCHHLHCSSLCHSLSSSTTVERRDRPSGIPTCPRSRHRLSVQAPPHGRSAVPYVWAARPVITGGRARAEAPADGPCARHAQYAAAHPRALRFGRHLPGDKPTEMIVVRHARNRLYRLEEVTDSSGRPIATTNGLLYIYTRYNYMCNCSLLLRFSVLPCRTPSHGSSRPVVSQKKEKQNP